MVDITNLHIHYRDAKTTKHKVIVIQPTNAANTLALKQDIARVVERIRNKAEYYYVVVEIDRGGKPGFRTIVPKTLL